MSESFGRGVSIKPTIKPKMRPVSTDIGKIAGKRLDFRLTDKRKHSNFCFLNEFLTQCGLPPYHTALLRIFSLARKLDFSCMLLDEIVSADSKILTEENSAIAKVKSGYLGSKVYKFSFFKEVGEESQVRPKHFLGYVVFKVDYFDNERPFGYIFESIMSPPRDHSHNSFLHCRRHYSVTNSIGNGFVVEGTLYAQQSGYSFVCAHVAIRTALACVLPDGDISYSTIAQLSKSRSGLEPNEMSPVFDALGIQYQKLAFEPSYPSESISDDIDFMKMIYGHMESSCPVLLGFEGTRNRQGIVPRHIVPILGHTFNEDSWVPPSNRGYFGNTLSYYPSEQWASSHLIHDDNFGAYYCVPKHFISRINFRLLFGISRNCLSLLADKAEAIALNWLYQYAIKLPTQDNENNRWFNLFQIYAQHGLLVLRPIFVSKDDYLTHLRESLNVISGEQVETSIINQCDQSLPENFWMVEVSCPELFSATRRKFGEVILSSDSCENAFDYTSFLMLRLPGLFILKGCAGSLQKVLLLDTDIKGHTQIFSEFD